MLVLVLVRSGCRVEQLHSLELMEITRSCSDGIFTIAPAVSNFVACAHFKFSDHDNELCTDGRLPHFAVTISRQV